MRGLLDVNVLLALLDGDHVDHGRAREYLTSHGDAGWASCPITENGFVRIISQPRYPSPVSPAAAIERLQRACTTEHHERWYCGLSILDDEHVDRDFLLGPRQVTDAYLLALAVTNGGRLVTFDRNVPLRSVRGATDDHLHIL